MAKNLSEDRLNKNRQSVASAIKQMISETVVTAEQANGLNSKVQKIIDQA
jgi:hypothetical protein